MEIACRIIFVENPKKIFYTGQSIKGYVNVALKSEQVIRNIFVRIDGVASTKWDLGRIVRCSKDDFLNHQMSVLSFGNVFSSSFPNDFPFFRIDCSEEKKIFSKFEAITIDQIVSKILYEMFSLFPDERRLLPRNHKFPFQFALPQQLPSSFESEFGVIRYSVKVMIEIPFQPTKKVEENITIIKLIDFDDSDLQVFNFYNEWNLLICTKSKQCI